MSPLVSQLLLWGLLALVTLVVVAGPRAVRALGRAARFVDAVQAEGRRAVQRDRLVCRCPMHTRGVR